MNSLVSQLNAVFALFFISFYQSETTSTLGKSLFDRIQSLYTLLIYLSLFLFANVFNIGASWLIENNSLFLTPSQPIFQNEAPPGIRLGLIVEKRACDHFKNKSTSILGISRC